MKKAVMTILAMLSMTAVATATEYWFAFEDHDLSTERKSFTSEIAWTETIRIYIDPETQVQRRLVFVEATAKEYAAGWGAFPDAKKTAAIVAWDQQWRPPQVFPDGIEIPPGKMLVLNSETNKAGWSIFTLDDGSIKTVQVHASPWKTPAEIQAEMDDVRVKHKADKDKALSEINGQLQKRIENLERLMGLRP